jgi:hypothetical protein
MTPGDVEDDEEYEISKYLLDKFICSQTVLDVVGEHWFLVYKVIKFLRGHVYTWETLYLHSRLPIPAGILRISVFFAPVAFFSQESRFLFRCNFFGTSSGNLSVWGLTA